MSGAHLGAAALLVFLASVPRSVADCTIDLNLDYNTSSPLLLDKDSLEPSYPSRASAHLLSLHPGEVRVLYCPGGQLVGRDASTERASCVTGKNFASGRREYAFPDLACTAGPAPVTRELGGCGNGVLVEIGYQLGPRVFRPVIDLCHDKRLASTNWAHAKLRKVIGGIKNKDLGSATFTKGAYFRNVLMTQVYPRTYQVLIFAAIFDNDTNLVNRYLPEEGRSRNYLVKGHLVARADLFYPAEQYCTYSYVNALPMWQSVNNGNWKSVEATVRRSASSPGRELEVWTGGLGVLRLAGRDVYLARDRKDSSRPLMPVPRLLFKLVAAPGQAIVFVTANDPYLSDGPLPAEYKLCGEYAGCERFPQFKKRFEGYTYCCRYEEFMARPEVKALGLPVDFKNVAPLEIY